VIAPKGVHINWVKRELPKTISVPYIAAYYLAGNAKSKRDIEKLFDNRVSGDAPQLKVLAINYDALITKEGWKTINRFLRSHLKVYGVLDESTSIGNPNSRRTDKCMMLQPNLEYRRIATGTPVANSPIKIFSQMEWLESGLLGTTSYRAFVTEYAELIEDDSHLMRHIKEKLGDSGRFKRPLIIATDKSGKKIWRNLDKLHDLLEQHSYRVLKKDCIKDLPPKTFETVYFEMDAKHRKLYDQLKRDMHIEIEDDLFVYNKLTIINKLQQVTSGFLKIGDEETAMLDNKQRIDCLLETVDYIDDQIIIWARFRKEIELIVDALRKAGHSVVEYHGGINTKQREHAIDSFQDGSSKFFIGQQQAGGKGLTLTAAGTVIFFSNIHGDLELRLQAEDRAHRIGTTKSVNYIDIVALDTIDERIAELLQEKEETSAVVMGD
jgi:SNF2 family DNA or RNA helicase